MTAEALDLRSIEAQPILRERVARARRISAADAVERLIRIGLFTEAAPEGSTLIRRGSLPEWSPPEAEASANAQPWERGGPPPTADPEDGDILF